GILGGMAKRRFWQAHSLSLIVSAVLVFFLLMYIRSDPSTHIGAFFGNAVADWFGTLVFVVATKYFFEVGSRESRRPRRHLHERALDLIEEHSLTIVLVLTGAIWVVIYSRIDANGKAGQVVGNIVSEWTQVLGLVLITKFAREVGSKEG